jgi:hypothetical protein
MGAAGHAEYDYWDDDDDDDDESLLASDLEDEETGKPSKPGQAEGEKVEAWLGETRSLGKRRRSWLEEMMLSRIPKTLRSVPDSSSQAGLYSDSGLLSAQDSRQGSVITV